MPACPGQELPGRARARHHPQRSRAFAWTLSRHDGRFRPGGRACIPPRTLILRHASLLRPVCGERAPPKRRWVSIPKLRVAARPGQPVGPAPGVAGQELAAPRPGRVDLIRGSPGRLFQDIHGRGGGAAAGPASWDALRARARMAIAGLPAPPGPGPGLCAACRGPLRRGYTRCFQCSLHAQSAPGMLADIVAPVAYAPKGGSLATNLWLYKSALPGAGEAGTALRALLLVFLHDHGRLVWQQAGMTAPTHACVVPSCRGRPG